MWYSYIILISEIVAFLFAIIYWRRYRKSTERIFLFLLGYTVVTEQFGTSLANYFDVSHYFVYNIYKVVSFSVYFYWFCLILKRKIFAYLFLTIFLLITLYLALVKSFWGESWVLLNTFGSIFTIICVGIYYLELMGLNTIYKTTRSQKFWIASGLFIFYLGYLPLNLFQFDENPPFILDGTQMYIRSFIHMSLCVFLYGFYIISFICIRKK